LRLEVELPASSGAAQARISANDVRRGTLVVHTGMRSIACQRALLRPAMGS